MLSVPQSHSNTEPVICFLGVGCGKNWYEFISKFIYILNKKNVNIFIHYEEEETFQGKHDTSSLLASPLTCVGMSRLKQKSYTWNKMQIILKGVKNSIRYFYYFQITHASINTISYFDYIQTAFN